MTTWRKLQKCLVSPGMSLRCSFLGRTGLMKHTSYVMLLQLTLQEELLWSIHWKWGGLHNWWCPILDMKTMRQWNHILLSLTRPGRTWWKPIFDEMNRIKWKGNDRCCSPFSCYVSGKNTHLVHFWCNLFSVKTRKTLSEYAQRGFFVNCLVEHTRLELVTSWLPVKRSSQMS